MNRRIALSALASLGIVTSAFYACSENNETAASGDPAGPGATTSAGGNNTTAEGGATVSVGQGGSQGGMGGTCAGLQVEATYDTRPADIIFVIDNSGSMGDEIDAVQQNINVNFASIIQSSMIDYQVIMLTNHGVGYVSPSYLVCIAPPLSGTTNCNAPPVNVPGQFYHYSVDVQSWDSVCKIFDTLYGPTGGGEPDDYGFAPNGWSQWLRPEAVKVFVEISDDQMNCTWQSVDYDGSTAANGQQGAVDFDSTLLSLAPAQFGTPANRNYLFYSIVGLASKPSPNELDAYSEFEPIVSTNCSCSNNPTVCVQSTQAYNPGYGYQWLSKGTESLRFPVCNTASYDQVFADIAAGIIDAVQLPCEFDIPQPMAGEELDLETTDVLYTPGGGGATQEWQMVESPSQCGPGKFYLDLAANKIILCPEACAVVEADIEAKLEVRIECGGID